LESAAAALASATSACSAVRVDAVATVGAGVSSESIHFRSSAAVEPGASISDSYDSAVWVGKHVVENHG
jgi:hypothetical protein